MDFDWAFFVERIVNPGTPYINALGRTVSMAVLAMFLGLLIGLVVGFGRLSRYGLIRSACGFYVWLIRGIPVLVLLVMLFSGMAAAGLFRFTDLEFAGIKLTASFQAAVIGLAIHEGAYMAEILRSSIMSVDDGQALAARALGMTPTQVMRKVVIPQLTRIAIPPTANEYIGMIKYTSLASVISLQELLTRAGNGVSATFRFVEYYAGALVYYLVIVSVLMVLQARLEKRYAWISTVKKSGKV